MKTITNQLRFPEGPIALPDGSVLVVEIERGTISKVEPNGEINVVAEPGGGPNGIAIGPSGKCFACNNGGFNWIYRTGRIYPGDQADDYSGGRIERIDLDTGEVEILYEAVNGNRLCGPNDIVFDDADGFWFTDHGKNRARDRDRTGVYYAKADGSYIEEVIFPLESPNGIGLSANNDELYVAETPTARLWAFKLAAPGKLLAEREDRPDGGRVVNKTNNRPGYFMFDSLAVDSDGGVAVATLIDGGVTTFYPDGRNPKFVPMVDRLTTNVCFGGPDLTTAYITLSSTGSLVSMDWDVAGLPLNYLNK